MLTQTPRPGSSSPVRRGTVVSSASNRSRSRERIAVTECAGGMVDLARFRTVTDGRFAGQSDAPCSRENSSGGKVVNCAFSMQTRARDSRIVSRQTQWRTTCRGRGEERAIHQRCLVTTDDDQRRYGRPPRTNRRRLTPAFSMRGVFNKYPD